MIAFLKNKVIQTVEKYSGRACRKKILARVNLSVYEIDFHGEEMALFLGFAGAAMRLEELIAMGVNNKSVENCSFIYEATFTKRCQKWH